jgi:hypothetical protein
VTIPVPDCSISVVVLRDAFDLIRKQQTFLTEEIGCTLMLKHSMLLANDKM